MIDENKFRAILQQLLAKSIAGKVRWTQGTPTEGGELYTVLFPDSAELAIYYNSPPEAPDLIRASLFISERFVVGLNAEDGGNDWDLLKSLLAECRRCVFHFDEAVNAIETVLASDSIGLPRERAQERILGKWEHSVNGRKGIITLLESGWINAASTRATWILDGKYLKLIWPTSDAPVGAWIDKCELSADGTRYEGKNQVGAAISGKKLPDVQKG